MMSARRHQVGALIRDTRIAAGLTQRQLADAAGVSLGALRDLEQGRTSFPRWSVVQGLAGVLGLDEVRLAGLRRAASTGIRFEALGPLTVWRDGGAIALGSARQRAVLGLLVLYRGTGLDRDAIIDTLWGPRPPVTVVTELQGHICRLRKVLGAEHADGTTVISRVGLGYRLMAEGDQLDAVAFERLVAQAGRMIDRGQTTRSCTLYEQALSLWRGEVLADIDLLRHHPAVTSLACRHSDAVLLYAAAAEAAGVPGRVLPHLRGLCDREPFNEQAHASMMLALAATGQQVAALKVFTKLRRRLDDELGMPPSPLLAEAQIRVLRQRAGGRLAAMREGGSRTIGGGFSGEWVISAEVHPLVGHMTDYGTVVDADDVIPVLVCGESGVSAVIA
jgi:DNA-binding SARP family transcriptional activator/DNA-binding XRE family transcriptional regulator